MENINKRLATINLNVKSYKAALRVVKQYLVIYEEFDNPSLYENYESLTAKIAEHFIINSEDYVDFLPNTYKELCFHQIIVSLERIIQYKY